MNRSLTTVTTLGLGLALAVVLAAAPAHAQELEKPVRGERKLLLTATGEGLLLFSDGQVAGTGLGGLQLSLNLHPNVSLDLAYRTVGYFNGGALGARYFFFKHTVSPYLYLRAGVAVLTIEHEVDATAMANLAGGGGVEVSLRNGFNLFTDAGADCFVRERSTCGLRMSLGLGYRF